MARLYENFRRAGGAVNLGAAARSLEPAAGGHWRVGYRTAAASESVIARSVLFADGGFQANQEMLARYVGPNAGQCLLRATPTGTGDGLRLLLGAGAATVGLGRLYGHLVSIDALHSDELWPFPHLDELCLKGALVTRRGDLFPVTVRTAVGLVTRLARTDDPRGFAAICDSRLWSTAGTASALGLPVANPDLVKRGGHLARSDTIAGLADALGVARDRLEGAIRQHNSTPGAIPVAQPPFYAARTIPGITFTMGGARIGPDAAVIDLEGRPIAGLFAAGSTAGGIHGGPDGGYVGGLGAAATFGLIAAGTIAARQTSPTGALDMRERA
jgi:fumarate reductase flavoprotein subunit